MCRRRSSTKGKFRARDGVDLFNWKSNSLLILSVKGAIAKIVVCLSRFFRCYSAAV